MTREEKIAYLEGHCYELSPAPCEDCELCGLISCNFTAMSDNELDQAIELIKKTLPRQILIRYIDTTLPEIGYVEGTKSDMIDLYSRVSMFIVEGSPAMIPLNVAMKLPEGYEAHVYPRSSTFKNTGLIQTNSVGIIDESYCGDTDEWHFPCYLMPGCGKQWAYQTDDGLQIVKDRKDIPEGVAAIRGTWISAGDRLCQFRIVEHMPPVKLVPVPHLEGEARGGFGTTGR